MITHRLRATSSPAITGSAYYLFFWSMNALYIPFFHVYLTELGLTGAQVGFLAAILPLATLTISPFVSGLADQRGWRLRFLRIGFVGWAIVLLLYRFPTDFSGIFVLVCFGALFRSPVGPIGDSIIARMASSHHLNYGGMRLWGSAGFAAVSILGGLLWQRFGYPPMFIATAVAIIPCLWITRQLPENRPVATKSRRPPRQLFLDPALLTMFVGALLAGAALFAANVFGGIYINQLGGARLHIGLLFGLSALAEVPVMQASNWLIRRFRGDRALLLGYIALGISLLIYTVAQSPWALIFAAVIKGIGFGLFFVITVRLIDSRIPEAWVSTAQSVFAACFMGLAPLSTTMFSGYIFDKWGGSSLFGLATAVVLVGIALLSFASWRGWFNRAIDWESD